MSASSIVILVISNPVSWSGCLSSLAAPSQCNISAACHPYSSSVLSSLGESLPFVPYVSSQYLEALPSQSAVSKSESRVPDAMSE
ncbi:hypothetical protein Tco_1030223 [Tanacetum coccineum]|uniref:Secreted protein n=1 Tax=Tanacetum coccineum TaxID=301880 RepID=A0ABQ5G5M4_9ASTR